MISLVLLNIANWNIIKKTSLPCLKSIAALAHHSLKRATLMLTSTAWITLFPSRWISAYCLNSMLFVKSLKWKRKKLKYTVNSHINWWYWSFNSKLFQTLYALVALVLFMEEGRRLISGLVLITRYKNMPPEASIRWAFTQRVASVVRITDCP